MPVASKMLDHVGVAIHDRVVIATQPMEGVQDQTAMRLEKLLPGALLRGRVRGVQQMGELGR
jgi:hypothetical protein